MNVTLQDQLRQTSLQRLTAWVDEAALNYVGEILRHTPCLITPVKVRRTKHGDFQPSRAGSFAEITVNGSGNRYQFLLTLLHEIAHALAYQRHGKRIAAHGAEWRAEFAEILREAVQRELFPAAIIKALRRQLRRPSSSSSRDPELQLALRAYDTTDQRPMVAELPPEVWFSLDGKLILQLGPKLRTRYRCVARNGMTYTVPASARVHTVLN
jgi:SprT protein